MFHIRTSQQRPPPPPYTSVKHETSGKVFQDQRLRPPNYTPPPPYTSPPDSHKRTGTPEPDGALPDLGEKDRSGSRSCDLRQIDPCFVSVSSKGGHIQGSSSSDRTQHLPELQKQNRNQQHALLSQSSEHEEKYQTSHSHTTLTKPRRRRRSEGTVLISHMEKIMGSSSSPDYNPLKCRTLPHLKSSTSENYQLKDEDDSSRQLNTFTQGPTVREEPREEHQNHKDYNIRLSKYVEELRNQREELRKVSPEKRHFLHSKKSKHEDTNSAEVQNHFRTHHQTIPKFPFWKEPRSSYRPLMSTKKSNRSKKVQCSPAEPKRTSVSEENMGLVVIDATCVLIKVEFISSTAKEPVQYVSSCPTVSSNKKHENSGQVTDRRSELKIINGTRPTSSKVQPEDQTSKEGTERILGIENVQIPRIISNRGEVLNSVSEDKTMLENSEVTHREVLKFHTRHEAMTRTRQDNDLQSAGRKFTLEEEKVPDSANNTFLVEIEDEQNLNRTLLRNSSGTFSQKCLQTKDRIVHNAAERADLNQAEKAEDLLNSYERDTDEMLDQEDELMQENPSIIFHNRRRTNPCSLAVKVSADSLWDVMSRIRKHTAPDSETEEDEGDIWEPVQPSQDDLSEKCGIKGEECVLEDRSGCAEVNLDGAEDSSSSSSVESQDTVIETTHTRNIPET